jgi:uncharacterized membrane-anchored protein YjiN (DUF445 family)
MSSESVPSATNPNTLSRSATTDVGSLLTQLSNLQTDRERLARELEMCTRELSSLKENKREEMRKIFETVIQKWLSASVNDEQVRKQFSDGMERIIEKTQENGVWTVAVEASHLHEKQIQELEKLRAECEQLKQQNPSFQEESSRKRPREAGSATEGKNDFWTGFELDISSVV